MRRMKRRLGDLPGPSPGSMDIVIRRLENHLHPVRPPSDPEDEYAWLRHLSCPPIEEEMVAPRRVPSAVGKSQDFEALLEERRR